MEKKQPFKSVTNPQKENGYTALANEIIEALAHIRISGEEMQCLWVILRKTYGWQKKLDGIAHSQFVLMTGLKKQNANRALKHLKEKNLITVIKNDDSQIITYGLNKDYSQWKPLSKKITVINIDKTVIKNDDKALSKKMTTKERKKLTNEIYTIFDYWNSKNIIEHREIQKFKSPILAKLKNYSVEEIKQAISNYVLILKSDEHYFTHKWGLDEFLSRKGNLDKFLTVNDPFHNFKNFKKKENEKTHIENAAAYKEYNPGDTT